ncbi:hypothetical protein [Sphingobacterium siyangense]|uniref:hypothetical protein n=1 Tax=Sphingobacterium siyangense TaxID=459529 RepID=UPI003DA601D2
MVNPHEKGGLNVDSLIVLAVRSWYNLISILDSRILAEKRRNFNSRQERKLTDLGYRIRKGLIYKNFMKTER